MPDTVPLILVVDDEAHIRLNLVDYFEDCGYRVASATCAEDGLEMVEKQQPDLCIVDMRLPGMDGNDFIERVLTRWPQIKVIIHTGSTEYSLPPRLLELGVTPSDVLKKPVHDLGTFGEMAEQAVGPGEDQ